VGLEWIYAHISGSLPPPEQGNLVIKKKGCFRRTADSDIPVREVELRHFIDDPFSCHFRRHLYHYRFSLSGVGSLRMKKNKIGSVEWEVVRREHECGLRKSDGEGSSLRIKLFLNVPNWAYAY
jgi:hypothetical protein